MITVENDKEAQAMQGKEPMYSHIFKPITTAHLQRTNKIRVCVCTMEGIDMVVKPMALCVLYGLDGHKSGCWGLGSGRW